MKKIIGYVWGRQKFFDLMLYAVFLILMTAVIACKQDYHVDEIFSYGSSNHIGSCTLPAENGKTYEPAAAVFMDYMTADRDNCFHYGNVWANQSKDVHPPFYYAILHTICSFFPGTFSKWYAGIVNIIFAILLLYAARKLVKLFSSDKFVLAVVSVSVVLCAGILTAVSYYRMYVLAMFFVTLTAYLLVNAVISDNYGWKFYLSIMAAAVLGTLTHYYYTVYLVLSCCVFFVYIVIRKKWSAAVFFPVSMAAAGGICIIAFPGMIYHIFSGHRGVESVENLTNTSAYEYWGRIKGCFELMNNQVFGGFLPYILLFGVLMLLVSEFVLSEMHTSAFDQRKEGGVREEDTKRFDLPRIFAWLLLIVPVTVYFFLISKIAIYVKDRFIFPVYAVTLVLAVMSVCLAAAEFIADEKARHGVVVFAVSVMIANSWKDAGWEYLYASSAEFLQSVKEESDIDAIVIYDEVWKASNAFREVSNYKSLTFIPAGDLNLLSGYKYADAKELRVIITVKEKDMIKSVTAALPGVDSCKKVRTFQHFTTYHLYRST